MDINSLSLQLQTLLTGYLPNILGAIGILILGFLLSYVCMSLSRSVLKKFKLNKKLSKLTSASLDEFAFDKWAGRAVFTLVMIFVLIGFFQALGLSGINQPLNILLESVFSYIPRLVAPLVLFFIAWVVATTLKFMILKISEKLKLEDKIKSLEETPHSDNKISATFAEIVYWLVFVLFLPVVLDSLALKGLLGPINTMVEKLLSFLPNLFAAVAIILIGWVLAKVIQKITINFLKSIGINALADKVGISKITGNYKFSDILGTTVYIVLLIPIAIAGLSALKINSITEPASLMLGTVLDLIPSIFAAIGILLIAYIAGKFLCELLSNFLKELGFDNILVKLGISVQLQDDKTSPSAVASYASLFSIMLFATIEAFNVIGLVRVADILNQFTYFLGSVAFGLLVFAIGLYLANLVANIIKKSTSTHATVLSVICRIAIITLSGSMALEQIAIADNIITTAFGLVLAGLALAFGLAFGLGGREEAAKFIADLRKKL